MFDSVYIKGKQIKFFQENVYFITTNVKKNNLLCWL